MHFNNFNLLLLLPAFSLAARLSPYYEEIYAATAFLVNNSTLIPKQISASTGEASLSREPSTNAITQFHTHVNVVYPEWIIGGNCTCQISFRLQGVSTSSATDLLDIFKLESPTSETNHPEVLSYEGRVQANELVKGSEEAWTKHGMLPFECASLGGKTIGYEVTPRWWDDSEMKVTWTGEGAGLVVKVWGMDLILWI